MRYILGEKQIEEIIKKGKLDKEKYAYCISAFDFTTGEVLERYLEKNYIPLVKNKNKIYEHLDELSIGISDYVYDEILNEIEEITKCRIREIEDNINYGEIK